MKLLFVTRDRSKRGGHIILTSLMKELRNDDYEVSVATFRMQGEPIHTQPEIWNDFEDDIIEIPFDPGREIKEIKQMEFISEFLNKIRNEYDRIVLDSWYIAGSAIMAGMLHDRKVWHLIQSNPEFIPEDLSAAWKALLFKVIPNYSSNKITVSQALSICLKEKYSVPSEALRLCLADEFFQSGFEVRNRKILKIVSTAADFNIPSKGLNFLLKNISQFKKFPFELTLVSGQPIRINLNKFDFPISVKTAESAYEMAAILKENDIYINTSQIEGFCLCLAEAMALGLPAIALDSTGNRDYMDGSNALFLKDSDKFLEKLAMLKSYKLRKRLSSAARRSMRGFTLRQMVEDFKRITRI